MSSHELRLASPVFAILAAAFAVIAVDLFAPKKRNNLIEWIAYGGIIAAIFLQRWGQGEGGAPIFGGALKVDGLSDFVSLAVLISAALTILVSMEPLAARGVLMAEYVGLVLIASAGMMLLAMSHDLITMFLSIEIMSIALYVLCGITRTDPRSNEAAMKYFVIGAFATGFLLYGMTFLYGATGTVFFSDMHLHEGKDLIALTGVGLLIAGFAFKIGAAPFHMWVPDVYEGAPTQVTAFMSVAVKAAGIGALIRLLMYVMPGQSASWRELTWALAALTMIVGNLGALTQTSVKRMLAYSSIAHTGYALVGLTAGAALTGSGTMPQGPAAALFYTFVYAVMTLGAFLFLVLAGKPTSAGVAGRELESFDSLAGLGKRRPWAAAFMTLFMVSLAGIPPTAGFFGKFMVFKSAVEAGQTPLAVIGILTSIVSVYYYLRVVVVMYMHEPAQASEATSDAVPAPAGDFNAGMAVVIAGGLTVLLGLFPNWYVNMARSAVEALVK